MPIRKRKRPARRRSPFYSHAADVERAIIIEALNDTADEVWNVTKAAKSLSLPLSTMKWKMNRYKIERPA
jgi:transcriptional regulator with GAF, ATPase, and Fis domain